MLPCRTCPPTPAKYHKHVVGVHTGRRLEIHDVLHVGFTDPNVGSSRAVECSHPRCGAFFHDDFYARVGYEVAVRVTDRELDRHS